jgi:hypothetical protein
VVFHRSQIRMGKPIYLLVASSSLCSHSYRVDEESHGKSTEAGNNKNPKGTKNNGLGIVGQIAVGTVTGVVGVAAVTYGSAALVPYAMYAFGTVVPGVGTIHASLAAGGVAANLQFIAATWGTQAALTNGAIYGATVAGAANVSEIYEQYIGNFFKRNENE